MDIQATKLDLIKKLLDTTEESVLDDVRKVLTKRQDFEYSLSDGDYILIDKRRERHIKGESSSFSWDEVKKQARHTAAK
ncbi:MAG TPA: hypothetical protein VKM37_05210 [Balneolaceae bacterium]|nr:hypothetical protein [Balneolaceae bacterium]